MTNASDRTSHTSFASFGGRRHRITLQNEVHQNGVGGRFVTRFDTLATCWAGVMASHHAPLVKGDRLEYPTTLTFVTHYARHFLTARRILFEGRVFEILSVNNPDCMAVDLEFRTREIKAP